MHISRNIFSLCCIVAALCCLVQCATPHASEHKSKRQKDSIENAAESNVYKIKRLDNEGQHQRNPYKLKSTNKNKVKSIETIPTSLPLHPVHPPSVPSGLEGGVTTSEVGKKPTKFKKPKNTHGLNKKLLSKLGFTKVKAPNSHNRKRLAIESRRHVSPDDSHMFIIKLPPNAHYYSSPKAAAIGRDVTNSNSPNSLPESHGLDKGKTPMTPMTAMATATTSAAVANDNGKKVSSFPFNSNGRPGRIYHWNLPIIQKILEDKQRFAHVPNAMKQQLIDIKDIPTWTKPWENETIEKSFGKANMMHHYKKSLKRKSPSYYAPASTVSKNSFHKYFAGNGKPKGFFVIKENQKKPQYYKNIVS